MVVVVPPAADVEVVVDPTVVLVVAPAAAVADGVGGSWLTNMWAVRETLNSAADAPLPVAELKPDPDPLPPAVLDTLTVLMTMSRGSASSRSMKSSTW